MGKRLVANRILTWFPRAFLSSGVMESLTAHDEPSRGFIILTSTCDQVNFWTRLLQSLGVPPAGFSAQCDMLDLDACTTLRPNTQAGARLR